MRLYGFILLSFLMVCPLQASELQTLSQQADSAYVAERYEEARDMYLQLADSVQDAQLYYNLGCAYFRTEDIAHAILWFERALVLDPANEDIRFNLEFARSRTIDRITPRHEMFFVSFWRSMVHGMSTDTWGMMAVCFFVGILLMALAFLYLKNITIRKVSFALAVVMFFGCVLCNICAWQLNYYNSHRTAAVIVDSSVTIKSTPSQSGNDLFVLHEGTTVEINDDSMREWCEISIADGKMGWMPRAALEKI